MNRARSIALVTGAGGGIGGAIAERLVEDSWAVLSVDKHADGDTPRQHLFDDANKTIGTLFTDCVNVGASARVLAATLQCTATDRFHDGQIVLAGVSR
jgi:NAD(P)-dependent dehydrogenase (short-subunit alcohol dehydrogenase family)